MTGEEMLRQYGAAKGKTVDVGQAEIGPFGDSPEMAAQLLELILIGKKRATCWVCIDEVPPGRGALTVITDWMGEASCVLETVCARKMKLSEVTWALAQKEGEDECFQTWKEGHRRFFSDESVREGYPFSEDMEIIFEEFRVVWPEELADEK